MNMKTVYLLLAVAGTIIPYAFFLQHFQSSGFNIIAFARAVFANGAAGGFAVDLVISSLAFWIVMVRAYRKGAGPGPGLFVILNLLVGLSCALPAWLYAREARLCGAKAGGDGT